MALRNERAMLYLEMGVIGQFFETLGLGKYIHRKLHIRLLEIDKELKELQCLGQ